MGQSFARGPSGVSALSAGTQIASGGTIVFSNANGVTFGMANSSVITASVVAAGMSLSYWDNGCIPNSSGQQQTVNFQRINVPGQISATLLNAYAGPGINSTYTIWPAIYTMTGSTLSLASSTSFTQTGGAAAFRTNQVLLGTWNITPGEYMFHLAISVSGGTKFGGQLFGSRLETIGTVPYFADAQAGTITAASYHLTDLTAVPAVRPFLQLVGTF